MGKAAGFLEYERKTGAVRAPKERIQDFREFHESLPLEEQKLQGARCMDCGVPFCQFGGMLGGMASGCPLHNLVPEFNDLVYRGNLEAAWQRLKKTHCFPEFTSRVCPALCEAACTCNVHSQPVSTKENERTIVEYAFAHGLVSQGEPAVRTGYKVAVVGSGPSGLAAALQLNRRGHKVTVFERRDRVGGLLMYGIPNMKLDKAVLARRQRLMEEEGVEFVTGVEIGKDKKAEELLREYDRVILACGASRPRDIKAPGRELSGIRFAVDFLSEVTKTLLDSDFQKVPYELARGKHVVVIGGGDTGNDCVGTAIRLGAASVTQLEMMPKPSESRTKGNPWPEWPRVLKTDYGQEEAIAVFGQDPRIYQTTVQVVSEVLGAYPDLSGIYMANLNVSGCAEAVRAAGKTGQIRVICHDINEGIRQLLCSGSVDYTIPQDFEQQGYGPIMLLRDLLRKGKTADAARFTGRIGILCRENL